ncbi:MAG: dTDP-4-dehydrorhamnose 3,5-epimerase [Patescibacteria group bacterium]
MKFNKTKFEGAWIIEPDVYQDKRGFFLESYIDKWFKEKNIKAKFVQDNHSKSVSAGVLRGLHYQKPPFAQAKLVRVTSGAVYDVIVDLRKKSKTYGVWQSFELTDKNFKMLYIPKGFAHAFCTLQAGTEFLYKVDSYYSPKHDSGIIWNDPTLKITWPIQEPVLSQKDLKLGFFNDLKSPF